MSLSDDDAPRRRITDSVERRRVCIYRTVSGDSSALWDFTARLERMECVRVEVTARHLLSGDERSANTCRTPTAVSYRGYGSVGGCAVGVGGEAGGSRSIQTIATPADPSFACV